MSQTDLVKMPVGVSDPQTGLASMLRLPDNFPMVLLPNQEAEINHRLAGFKFEELALTDISSLALDSEVGLSRALDGFLARIDNQSNPQIFDLVNKLNVHVDKAKLPDLAAKIVNGKPPLMARLLGLVHPATLKNATSRMFEDISRAASTKSANLADLVSHLEVKLRQEMTELNTELRHMDAIKDAYRESFLDFAAEAAFLHNALRLSRETFIAMEPELKKDHLRHQDALDKLQALESRALAIEGTMSRLPSDQLVIRQIQNAGVGTLQELATTMSSRFSSIKMTLLTIHGALRVRNVQRLGEQGAVLDANLSQVRSKLLAEVVTAAAEAPGKNREQQALQLLKVVSDTRELAGLVVASRAKTAEQFNTARAIMAGARKDMLALGQNLNPGATVARQTY